MKKDIVVKLTGHNGPPTSALSQSPEIEIEAPKQAQIKEANYRMNTCT